METNANLVPMGMPQGFVEDVRTGEVFDARPASVVVMSDSFWAPGGLWRTRGKFFHVWPAGASENSVWLRPLASLS